MKIHRISLSSEGYARLAYIAALEQISPKDWMEERIKEAWDHRDGKAISPIIQLDDKPKCGPATVADISPETVTSPKRRRLSRDTAAIEQLKDMWMAGERSPGKIAAAIGYPRSTVDDLLGRMLKSGELVD